MLRQFIFFTVLVLASISGYSQYAARSQGHWLDRSLVIPGAKLVNTSFACYEVADSCSKKGDSINAGAAFMKIDAYYLMYKGITPATLDTFFAGFLLTTDVQARYRQLFEATFSQPRTKAYDTIKAMHDEDLAMRGKVDNCADSLSCAVLSKRMRITDSIHFSFMAAYMQKNGWPSFENGALYAQALAIHNYDEQEKNLPFIKKAVLDGLAEPNTYYVMLRYLNKKKLNLTRFLSLPNKVVIDVSSVINEKMPDADTVEKIIKAVRDKGPIQHIQFVYESNNSNDLEVWLGYVTNHTTKNIASQIGALIFDNGTYDMKYIHADHLKVPGKGKKMKLYLLY